MYMPRVTTPYFDVEENLTIVAFFGATEGYYEDSSVNIRILTPLPQ